MSRREAFILVGLILAVTAGCNASSPAPTSKDTTGGGTTTNVSGSVTSAPAATASGSTTITTITTTPTSSGCPTGSLAVTLTTQGAAAGTAYSHLVFRNTSTRSCTMAGYPGLSFVDGSGHQIGAPVPQQHRFAGTVTLAPGASAGALFAYHDVYVGTVDGCQPTTAIGLRVYPPNQTAALVVARTLMVCANVATPGTASISEVTALANLP